MTHSNELLPSTYNCIIFQIAIGDSSQLDVNNGSSIMQLNDGCVNDPLFIHDISPNLLSIYQIFHSSYAKIATYSPIDVFIQELQNEEIVVVSRRVNQNLNVTIHLGNQPPLKQGSTYK